MALLDEIEGGLDHDVERGTRFCRALCDAQRCLMEHGIDPSDQFGHETRVADIAGNKIDLTVRNGVREIFRTSANHVIDDDNLVTSRIDEKVRDVRPNKTRAARDQHALALEQIRSSGRNRPP